MPQHGVTGLAHQMSGMALAGGVHPAMCKGHLQNGSQLKMYAKVGGAITSRPEMHSITITVVEAKQLPVMDVALFKRGSADPYVKITGKGLLGGHMKTHFLKKTLKPKWNKSFSAKFDYHLDKIKFKVYDYDEMTDDDLIGKCDIPIERLYGARTKQDFWLPIHKKHKPPGSRGQLRVQIQVNWSYPIAMPETYLPIQHPVFKIGLGWDFKKKKPTIDLDASIVALNDHLQIQEIVSYKRLKGMGGAVVHHGDNRTGKGAGDDEQVTVDLSLMPHNCSRLVVVVTSYTGKPLSSVKSAYVRLLSHNGTIAFYRLTKMDQTTGLFFAMLQREPSGVWSMFTVAQGVPGKTAEQALTTIKSMLTNKRW